MFTLYGDYIRHVGGSIWVGSLIQLLAHLGMSEQSVRSTIVRMSRASWLRVDRINRKSYYSLTPNGERLLAEGAARIFHVHSSRDRWDGQWRLVAYSIPETQRDKREQLRRQLGYLGFGPLTSALWITPHDLRREVECLAVELDIKPYVEFYTATHDGFSNAASLVAKCWDLPAINAQYAAFIERHRPPYDECRRVPGDIAPSECFVRRFMLIHEYRRFPFVDPELPPELVPADWHGPEAAALFQTYHDLLADKANTFFQSQFVGPPKPIDISLPALPKGPATIAPATRGGAKNEVRRDRV
jgi:phenylacetic acid degradation operon negative regulatory protein